MFNQKLAIGKEEEEEEKSNFLTLSVTCVSYGVMTAMSRTLGTTVKKQEHQCLLKVLNFSRESKVARREYGIKSYRFFQSYDCYSNLSLPSSSSLLWLCQTCLCLILEPFLSLQEVCPGDKKITRFLRKTLMTRLPCRRLCRD